MLDSGVYDESHSDSCLSSEFEEDISLKLADDINTSDHRVQQKMLDEIVFIDKTSLTSRAESTLRNVKDSYKDLRIKDETISNGRSDLGPLTGRFDKACRLSKSYYFDQSSSDAIKELISSSTLKKVSLSGSNLNCGDDGNRATDSTQKREDFLESLKKLFNSQLSKYGSATGSLCSITSSDYSSLSNDRSGRDDSADESGEFFVNDDDTSRPSFMKSENIKLQVEEPDVETENNPSRVEGSCDLKQTFDLSKDECVKVVADKRVELEIEETMPKLNWEFLEEQLEKAILKQKSCGTQLRDEILRKMAVEAEHDGDDDDHDDDTKIFKMSCDDLGELYHDVLSSELPLATTMSDVAMPTVTTSTVTSSHTFKTSHAGVFRCSTRKSKANPSVLGNQLQVCFVNEMSLEDDDMETIATPAATATAGSRFFHGHRGDPPSEYSTICSGIYPGEECDGKSLGVASQITKRSFESSKSSLHPLPALHISPKSGLQVDENFFTRQARLQAEARIALSQVRPMSYMQFLLEKQSRKESDIISQYDLPGILNWGDLRSNAPQRMKALNTTHLQIIINHCLSEITCLNEELMNLLLERDDLYIVQDSMLVDIEDFTRRAEEWEYKKLIGTKAGPTHPTLLPSSFTSSSSPSSSHVLSSLGRC